MNASSETGPVRAIAEMFVEHRPDCGCETPFIAYQEYTIRRLRLTNDTTHDIGRFAALMWFIEAYSPSRRPYRAPFGGRQIRWLLESNDAATEARAIPRVVEWFRRRQKDAPDPYADPKGYVETAYWWSVRRAPELNIEHALIPDAFVAALSAPVWGARAPVLINEFLDLYARAHPGKAWNFETEAGRLGAYMRVLSQPDGVHLGLFVPPDVLARIEQLSDSAAVLAGSPGAVAELKARVAAVRAYADQHKRLRSGVQEVCASLLGQDWMATGWTPPKSAQGRGRGGPRPAAPSVLPFPVRVIGPINSRSGLGQATRLSIRALEAAGVAVETVDFVLDNPAPRGDQYASVTPSPAPFAVNLLHLNAESLPLAPAYMAPSTFAGAYNIGYFFWELPQPALCHHLALHQLDEVWVSSEYNRDTYAPHSEHPVCKVGMAVEETDAAMLKPVEEVRAAYGLPTSATVFIVTFDSYSFMARKNPIGALRAFRAAFPQGGEDVRLVVKTHNLLANLGEVNAEALRREVLSLCSSDPRIVLINETLAHEEVMSLKRACDVYVSLHRSEGWGFGMIEGMQLGLPSIATGFSGNMEFCTDETAWLVPWTKTFLAPDQYIFFNPGDYWAEPNIAAAAQMMRAAAADRKATRAKGAAAKAIVDARFSPAAVGARYLERLRAIGAAAGRG